VARPGQNDDYNRLVMRAELDWRGDDPLRLREAAVSTLEPGHQRAAAHRRSRPTWSRCSVPLRSTARPRQAGAVAARATAAWKTDEDPRASHASTSR
jgi:hypothetical protein